jgi:hypothetical protein
MSKAKKKDRPDAKGRNANRTGSKDATIIFRRSFWLSPQVSALSPLERVLLLELTALYTGPKPLADVFLSVRDAAKRCGVSDTHAITRAFNTLEALGFVTPTIAGTFATRGGGKSKARGWRLNWKSAEGAVLGADCIPELDFAKLDNRQKQRVAERSAVLKAYAKGNFSVGESTTLAAIRADMTADSVEDSATLPAKKPSFASPPTVGDSTTHIYYQGGGGAVASFRQSIGSKRLANENDPQPFRPQSTERFCDLVKLRLAGRLAA